MKIWLMNHYATSMFEDRAGRHYWFAKELIARGYDVTVFCATTFLNNDKEIDTKGKVLTVKRRDGIPFVFVKTVVSVGNGMDRVKNMGMFYWNLFPAAKAYAKKYGKPDIILASSVHPLTMIAGIQIAKKMKIPCICEIRDLWPEGIFRHGRITEKSLLGMALTKGEHWIYKRADALIFTKEGDTDYLKEKRWTLEQGGDISLSKCHYINNGVDVKAFEERRRKDILNDPDLSKEKFNVIYAGTIRPTNHVGNLLDTAKLLLEKSGYEDVQILIFGDGMELPMLKERVERENIWNVRLKGFLERKFIPYILSCSSVNILNYAQDKCNWTRGNSSNKLFEYMASGRPVISTVHMGYSIINRYGCGVELDEDTPEALAEQIMKFHDMDQEEYSRIGMNAKTGAKDFDFVNLTDKLIKVIESVK
ncbi:MAG: glycosyltransferase family 4 protein [Dorea sp.]|nr:glycosyltransferase family 4 protein [Dorea sp.]